MLKEKYHPPRILYHVKLSFKSEGGIKTLKNWGNLLPVHLLRKKHYNKLFKEKENEIGQTLKYTQRKEEQLTSDIRMGSFI